MMEKLLLMQYIQRSSRKPNQESVQIYQQRGKSKEIKGIVSLESAIVAVVS